jgi:hypothetical protein
MSAFLKRMRWAVLLTCYRVVVSVHRLSRTSLSMDSFWRPHNLTRFRPYYVAPRTEIQFRHTYDDWNRLIAGIGNSYF